VRGIFSTLATVWRIAGPYFRSEDRWPGRLLLAAVIGIELSIVAISVLINEWNARFYNALQDRNWNAFVYQLGYFCVLATAFILLAVYQLYLNQWLLIRWRRWLTASYLDHWLEGANHYRMQLLGDAADNPDQRISEDISQFIQLTLAIGLQLLNSCVTLFSFLVILWSLSAAAPLHVFGIAFDIPGYLLWAALIYACIGTALTHLIGRPLIALNFQQQRYEADFRFNLVRVRENSEQIALLDGEPAERDRLLMRFGNVVANWLAIMSRQKKLTFFTASYAQASVVVPFVMVSPAYFANAIQLGGLMQTANAFGQVQNALSVFVTLYRNLAEWRAVTERLSGFDRSVATARAVAVTPPVIGVAAGEAGTVSFKDLAVRVESGKRRQQRWVDVHDPIAIVRNERGTEQPHVPGQHDVVGGAPIERPQHFSFVRFATREVAVVDDMGGVSPLTSTLNAGRVAAIRDHARDLCVELSAVDGLMDCCEIRPAPRKQDGETNHSIQLAKPVGGVSYCTVPEPFTTLPMK